MSFPSQIFLNDVKHGYREAISKKTSLWLVPFYMAVATYFYYEKMLRTMRTTIVSCLLKSHKEYLYNNDKAHASYLCETCETSLFLVRGLNKQKMQKKLPSNPHDLAVQL